VMAAASTGLAKPTVIVHLPIEMRPRGLERRLNEAAPSVAFKVMGRHGDFDKALKKEQADAVLSFFTTLEGARKYEARPTLQGHKGGQATEPYVLLSNRPINLSEGGTIGALTLLKRREMTAFVKGALGTSGKIKVRMAPKTEDLLTLLQLNMVEAILVRQSLVSSFQGKSTEPLVVQKLSDVRFGLPALGIISTQNEAEVVTAINGLGATIMGILGVDTWKKL